MGILKHNNRRTVCPPGKVPDNGYLPNIVVPTMMRSGTHLLIDLILNNFSAYKGLPLYCDLDRYIEEGGDISDLAHKKGIVIKTHFPQDDSFVSAEDIQQLLEADAVAISTKRSFKDIYQSSTSKSFALDVNETSLATANDKFDDFWLDRVDLVVRFEEMLTERSSDTVIDQVSDILNLKRNDKFIPNIAKSKRMKVYFYKFLTRLLGCFSPRVNTTIAFGKTK